jgi:hypothetical protein
VSRALTLTTEACVQVERRREVRRAVRALADVEAKDESVRALEDAEDPAEA